jgi:hypothetical protein
MIKSRRMKWARYVTCMGKRGIHDTYWWESQKERDHPEGLDVGGRIVLRSILKK